MSDLVVHPASAEIIAKVANSLPQSLLLTGPRGVGLGTIARSIANNNRTILATILPQKRQPSGSFIVDEINGTMIIDDIRDLYSRTRSKFTSSQVVIMDFADRTMSPQAQNAFLKLLEEPSPSIHFILATHHSELLLPTIVSRCQRVEIMPITNKQTDAYIDTLGITDPIQKTRMKFVATGLPAELFRLANDHKYYNERVQTIQDAKSILEGDSYERLRIIQKYKDNRVLALQLIDDINYQLSLALKRSAQLSAARQIDGMIDAYERIQANGNIQLQLCKVLL